ncbi:uncharacterized protein LOC134654101 [Cydia amplana]|uniref:uncharacterized protein LOC134654101 n=1 Tax=Cydia amplana TaxID=1869771 RepID=UPI002FE5D11E
MSIKSADALTNKLQHDLLNELITTNHLLQLISQELQEIKQLTRSGGEFEANVAKNTTLTKLLADMHHIDLDKLPPVARLQIDLNHPSNQNQSHEEHDTFRNNSTMEVDK